MLAIQAIDIERSDDKAYCGTLDYQTVYRSGVLLWTVEWRQTPEVVVEFFPGESFEDAELVRDHQTLLIRSLLDTLTERMGRETLFT
ncbi:MAG TPA: hypothetical protein V6D00_08060 [Pantanalinema sp.]